MSDPQQSGISYDLAKRPITFTKVDVKALRDARETHETKNVVAGVVECMNEVAAGYMGRIISIDVLEPESGMRMRNLPAPPHVRLGQMVKVTVEQI